MSRFFSVPFSAVAVSVAQDLFEITVGTRPIRLHEIVISESSDFGDSQAEGLVVSIKRGVGATAGSGGSTVAPVRHGSGNTAPGATAKVNNTTQATAGGGSLTTIRSETFNVQSGYQYLPIQSQILAFLPGETCVVSTTVPADSLTMSGTLVFEEL